MNWLTDLKGKVRLKEKLKFHTTFKIGGAVKFFVEPKDSRDLSSLLKSVKKNKLPLRIIGAGSNILASDGGFRGAVVRLSAPYFKKFSFSKNGVRAQAGTFLKDLLSACAKKGLANLEFLAGIPGTVGGALIMNAGARGKHIGDFIEEVMAMDHAGNEKTLKGKDLKFGYRNSNLGKYIVLGARLKLNRKDKAKIREEIKINLAYRRSNQDYSFPSAGCVFKNPGNNPAGKLIELCGLKGRRLGNASISRKHGNFIINLGRAKASDVLGLIALIRKKVKHKFRINLEPEIKIW